MDAAHNGILAGGVLLVYAASLLALAAQRLNVELILEKLKQCRMMSLTLSGLKVRQMAAESGMLTSMYLR